MNFDNETLLTTNNMNYSELNFHPNIHPKLWGEESWEISVRSESPSIIKGGPADGKALNEVLPEFPLLVKIIRARKRLSVQVHPNERTIQLTGGEPKTEMWCFLKKGFVYAGFKPGTTRDEVEDAIREGKLEELLVRHDGEAGDAIFIPGGLVHAIGENTEIYEVQQSSDTTFRLYDWNRVDENGNPRTLHLQQAMDAMDLTLPLPTLQREVSCSYFHFEQLEKGQSKVTESDLNIVYFEGKTHIFPKGRKISGPTYLTTF